MDEDIPPVMCNNCIAQSLRLSLFRNSILHETLKRASFLPVLNLVSLNTLWSDHGTIWFVDHGCSILHHRSIHELPFHGNYQIFLSRTFIHNTFCEE